MTTPAAVEPFSQAESEGASAVVLTGLKQDRGGVVGAVTILTLIVAVLGYLREAILAARFGLTSTMDAYFGAIFIPTTVYLILIVGTVSPILIPILLHEHDDDKSKTSESFSVVTNFVLVVSAAIVICGVAGARWWLVWLFSGFEPATQAMALHLIYIIFPAIPILALAGILTATLNGFHKFFLAAFAPALSSIAVIGTALLARGEHAIFIVGVGTAVGFALQFMILLPSVRGLGLRYSFRLRFRHPAIVRLIKLGGPLILYLVVANASSVIERNLASTLSAGTLSSLTYAMRLFTVPSNFLAAPLVIVAYPYFAREASRPGYGALRQELSRTLRYVLFIFVPMTTWLMLYAFPITRSLYERGKFVIADSLVVSHVFTLYAIGILPNAITLPLLRCFYAVEDTITPLWAEAIDLAFFVVCAPLLTHRFGISGLALTRGLTFSLVAAILTFVLWRKEKLITFEADSIQFVMRIAAATLVMTVVSWICMYCLQPSFERGGTVWRCTVIAIQMVISGATFLALALSLKLEEASRLVKTISRLVGGGWEMCCMGVASGRRRIVENIVLTFGWV